MFQANHVMTRALITLTSELSATEAIRILLQNRISGAPVVDRAGKLIGIISEFRLLQVVFDEATAARPISELMTTDVVTVDEDTPLTDVAQAFISLRIRRLPVLNNGKLVGQISRRDLLRCIINEQGDDSLMGPRGELVHPEVSATE